jgi:hypothetical protein
VAAVLSAGVARAVQRHTQQALAAAKPASGSAGASASHLPTEPAAQQHGTHAVCAAADDPAETSLHQHVPGKPGTALPARQPVEANTGVALADGAAQAHQYAPDQRPGVEAHTPECIQAAGSPGGAAASLQLRSQLTAGVSPAASTPQLPHDQMHAPDTRTGELCLASAPRSRAATKFDPRLRLLQVENVVSERVPQQCAVDAREEGKGSPGPRSALQQLTASPAQPAKRGSVDAAVDRERELSPAGCSAGAHGDVIHCDAPGPGEHIERMQQQTVPQRAPLRQQPEQLLGMDAWQLDTPLGSSLDSDMELPVIEAMQRRYLQHPTQVQDKQACPHGSQLAGPGKDSKRWLSPPPLTSCVMRHLPAAPQPACSPQRAPDTRAPVNTGRCSEGSDSVTLAPGGVPPARTRSHSSGSVAPNKQPTREREHNPGHGVGIGDLPVASSDAAVPEKGSLRAMLLAAGQQTLPRSPRGPLRSLPPTSVHEAQIMLRTLSEVHSAACAHANLPLSMIAGRRSSPQQQGSHDSGAGAPRRSPASPEPSLSLSLDAGASLTPSLVSDLPDTQVSGGDDFLVSQDASQGAPCGSAGTLSTRLGLRRGTAARAGQLRTSAQVSTAAGGAHADQDRVAVGRIYADAAPAPGAAARARAQDAQERNPHQRAGPLSSPTAPAKPSHKLVGTDSPAGELGVRQPQRSRIQSAGSASGVSASPTPRRPLQPFAHRPKQRSVSVQAAADDQANTPAAHADAAAQEHERYVLQLMSGCTSGDQLCKSHMADCSVKSVYQCVCKILARSNL